MPGSPADRLDDALEGAARLAMNDVHRPACEHELGLVPSFTEVGRARRFARRVLQERQIAPDRIAAAELLVSELVTNAIKTTSVMKLRSSCSEVHDHRRSIILRLRLVPRSVAIEVRDCSEDPPVLREQSPDSEEGRGLFLVASMSARWDYFRLSSGDKVVWCELDIARKVSANDVKVMLSSLPQRSRGSRQVRPLEIMTDPELLRRVRDGLLALGSDEGLA
jgi:anti-sigma regulatory factor (Ser/Thr protein kinase)